VLDELNAMCCFGVMWMICVMGYNVIALYDCDMEWVRGIGWMELSSGIVMWNWLIGIGTWNWDVELVHGMVMWNCVVDLDCGIMW